MKTRFDDLNSPARVRWIAQIAQLALLEEKTNGKPILYLTQGQIGRKLGASTVTIANAFRLSYTAEFKDEHGFGFADQGNGHSGEVFGYKLLYGAALNAEQETLDQVEYIDTIIVDHLRGVQETYTGLAVRRTGKTAKAYWKKAAAAELAADELEKTLV